MQHKLRWRTLSATTKAICLLTLFVFSAPQSNAAPFDSHVLLRPEVSSARRNELANKLRAITGWRDLTFEEGGALRVGTAVRTGGSETARNLLESAVSGDKVMLLEDASNRQDVVFCKVVAARWTKSDSEMPTAYVILIDFADFSHVLGDRAALEAFNVGWGVLHEIDHVVHDSVDTSEEGEAGECEESVNRMRRECGLAERADYQFSFLPGADDGYLSVKLVRLAFEQRQPHTNKKKRYWLLWDANLVGGLNDRALIAGFR